MLGALDLSGIANALGAKVQAAAVEATPELVTEPTLAHQMPTTAPKRRSILQPGPRQPSAKEHAERLLDWVHTNVELLDGPITHAAIMEFYTEMLIEQDWTPRPWNPVAHQFRLLTTGKCKVYAWITTTTGAVHRLRVYPIPDQEIDSASTPQPMTEPVGSRTARKLRRAA